MSICHDGWRLDNGVADEMILLSSVTVVSPRHSEEILLFELAAGKMKERQQKHEENVETRTWDSAFLLSCNEIQYPLSHMHPP